MRAWTIPGVCALALLFGTRGLASTLSFSTTIFDTNYVASAVGLRDVGTGDLTISGVSGNVTRAYLYWHGPTNTSDATANANVTFDGTAITGTNIGFSYDNFWNSENSQAYRADVTSLVTGNGTYSLSNFQKANVQINGASLIVFYDDGDSTNDRDVVLFHGNDGNFGSPFDSAGWSVTLPGIDYTSGAANLTMLVSDGQNIGTDDDGTIEVNGSPLASGGIFQGAAPKAPGAGVDNGSLFDVMQFDVTSFLNPGMNTLSITLEPGFNDALSAIVAAIDLPAGSAPPGAVIPEPSTYALMGAGLLLLAWRARRSAR